MENINELKQKDEIEALTAIYGSEFHAETEDNNTYSIDINVGGNNSLLQVTFLEDYPTTAPPIYVLSAPWLKGQKRKELCSYLEDVYLENVGESIVYLWVERIREFMIAEKDESFGRAPPDNELEYFLGGLEVKESVKESSPACLCPEIFSGSTIMDRKSNFQPHLAKVTSVEEVKIVLKKLYENRKIADATHNIYAYRLCSDQSKIIIQDSNDDGETHAGSRILFLLQVLEARNVMVVVSRWYGGINLGPDRFKHISNAARQILDTFGFVSAKQSQTSAKKHKKPK